MCLVKSWSAVSEVSLKADFNIPVLYDEPRGRKRWSLLPWKMACVSWQPLKTAAAVRRVNQRKRK